MAASSACLQSPEAETRRLVAFTSPDVRTVPLDEGPPTVQRPPLTPPEQSRLRFILGTVLPIIMITVGMYIQKTSHAGSTMSEPDVFAERMPHLPQKLQNLALLNRSCAPQLLAHLESGSRSVSAGAAVSVRRVHDLEPLHSYDFEGEAARPPPRVCALSLCSENHHAFVATDDGGLRILANPIVNITAEP